ncbi:Choline-sulfatase [Planctomycetes bacterium Pan216]|uniref:Choline-sulfatase n=1 Tax=Kolteria novifilia TaxID=2527975 RepID=A0A518B910_9BACT|nr:Choline-sulfatase [Planctomycetes bacterium Pan216]
MSTKLLPFVLAALVDGSSFWSTTGQAAEKPDSERHPNVLFISIDDLNDWLGCLEGHPEALTPNIDRLAKRGVLFTNAHCNVPVCSPSRTSLMTGMQPYRTGVHTNGDTLFQLKGKYTTLPEQFAANGYETLGAGKLFHSAGLYAKFFESYGPASGNQGGPFTRAELDTLKQDPVHQVDRGPGNLKATLPLNGMPDDRRTGKSRNNTFDWGPVDVSDDEMPDGQVAAWGVKQLERRHERPFFLGVGFYRPHQPLFAPRRYHEMFPPAEMTLPPFRTDDLDDLSPYARRLAVLPLTAGRHDTVVKYGQWPAAVSSYLASVRFVDELVGRVVDALDASPDASDTAIVLWSDHGYHLGQKRHWGKYTPWRESTRVPLIIVPPKEDGGTGFARGATCDRPVSLVDLYPTLLALCDLPEPHDLDGRSLLPLLEDPQRAWNHPVVTTVGRGTYSVRDQTHRYVRYFDGSEELYDLRVDPNEWTNVASDPIQQSVKSRLQAALPTDEDVTHFVRMGRWKAVIFKDPGRAPLLFELVAGTGGGGGIGETKSVASSHPEVLARIRRGLADLPQPAKHVVLAAR